jgi:hypothetical protein
MTCSSYSEHSSNIVPSVARVVKKSTHLLHPLTLAILAVCLLLGRPALTDDGDLLREKALNSSGVAGQLEVLGHAILSAVPEDAFPDRKAKAEAASYLKEHANRHELLSVVNLALKEDLDRETLQKVADFYDSKLGKKVGKAQSSALEASALKRVREGRPVLLSLDESRTALLGRIIIAQSVPQLNAQLLSTVVRGLLEGSVKKDADRKARVGDMNRKIRLIESEIHAEQNRIHETALISFAHMFRSLDDKELAELAAHEESPEAARFRAAIQRGLERAVFRLARELGEHTSRQPDHDKKRVPQIQEERSHQLNRSPEEATASPAR